MTKRITLAILVITWLVLVVGVGAAFLSARDSMLALMDDNLAIRASQLLDHRATGGSEKDVSIPVGDRYRFITADGKAVLESVDAPLRTHAPMYIVNKDFTTAPDGRRMRALTVGFMGPEGNLPNIVVEYSRPATQLDKLLRDLGWLLFEISAGCGLMTAWLALRVSRAALTPLRNTADAIATIDEKQLNRRIEMREMPIELIPMCERLNQLLSRLERAFSQRKQFLADVAHELRTPTAAMLTTLELAVRRPRDHSALVESIQTSLADAKLLRRLIDTLMEQVRSDHLMDRRVIETIDAAAMILESVRAVEGLASEKEVKLISDVPNECTITTQPDRLRSVLLNLLSNAIEYNRAGGTVRITLTRCEGGVELMVQDTGVGIPAEHLPHVFEPFYRADRASRNEHSHLGLGLFLVRSHVESMAGSVAIESRSGEGTTLKVRLPIAAETSSKPTEMAATD